jgi:hypothetical protein
MEHSETMVTDGEYLASIMVDFLIYYQFYK